jgi:O-methyltransferase involved in polyketide biosynthesis
MDPERDVKIAPTAHYTAYVWHRLRLPHAELFATERGRRLFWTFRSSIEWVVAAHPRLPSMVQYLELRHRAIEHALDEHQPDRIVELGAGLSRRGITWAADRGVRYIEVDLPHMVAAKREIIAERASASLRERAAERLEHVAVDVLSDQFETWLGETLAGAARPAVIAEGLIGYFDPDERLHVAGAIANALRTSDSGIFLADLRSSEGGRTIAAAAKILRGAIWIVTRGRGARTDFESSDAVRSFFRAAGFRTAEPISIERATPHLKKLTTPARVWRATT